MQKKTLKKRSVDYTIFHFPDKIGTTVKNKTFHHLKSPTVLNQEIVFHFGDAPITRRINETDVEFRKRTNIFKEKFSRKSMFVLRTSFEVIDSECGDEKMLENHIFLTSTKNNSPRW